jgi:hypothetical protein
VSRIIAIAPEDVRAFPVLSSQSGSCGVHLHASNEIAINRQASLVFLLAGELK